MPKIRADFGNYNISDSKILRNFGRFRQIIFLNGRGRHLKNYRKFSKIFKISQSYFKKVIHQNRPKFRKTQLSKFLTPIMQNFMKLPKI